MRLFRSPSSPVTRSRSWKRAVAAVLVFIPTAAAGEYRLQPGDALDVSVTGVPDLRQRASIGVEGNISLALIGQIKVSGLPVSQARAEIADELSNKVYRQYANDGHEIQHLILRGEIVVAVAEYRPVYVNGDVAKPGEYVFRPGMTVRQAVAVAGGYDLMQFRVANPFLQTADLQSEYEALWIQFAAEQARAWRLHIELGEPGGEDTNNKAPIAPEVGDKLMKAETGQLKANLADRQNDKALLQEAIKKADLQLSVLQEKRKADEEGSRADSADFDTVRDLFRKGLSPAARLSESRRAALFSSNQLLQTIVEMSNVERQRDEYKRQLDKIDSLGRINDLQDLQKTNLSIAQIEARLKSTSEKLMHLGLLRSQTTSGQLGRVEITVHRAGDDGPQSLLANADLELTPGDVVDVVLRGTGVVEVQTSARDVP